MAKIITLTFSPCIDKSTSVAALIPEKKLICADPQMEAGGGGINVARAIRKLGGAAIAIYPSGGYTGQYLNHLLQEENIPTIVIETGIETRENIIVVDKSNNNQFRFGMPATTLREQDWRQCLSAVETAEDISFIVASGSLPPGVPLDIYAQLAKIAKNRNAKFVVDTSGEALKHAATEGVYLLKPNLGELSSLAGKNELLPHEIKDVASQMIAKGNCEVMLVSMGAAGAMLVTNSMAKIISSPPVVKKSTVGAGDSMVAGMVYYLSAGKSVEEAAYYAVACGSAATMNPGTALCNKHDAERLYAFMKNSPLS